MGGIQVVIHRSAERFRERGGPIRDGFIASIGERCIGQAELKVAQALDGGSRSAQAVHRKVELLAVGDRCQQIPDRLGGITFLQQVPQGVKIAERLRHLLAINQQKLAVQPIADEGFSRQRFRLRDFIFVVREDQVGAAGVNVKRLAEIFRRHNGALDVPARPSGPELGFPEGFPRLGRFPQHEVPRVGLLVLVLIHSRFGVDAAHVHLGQFSVRWKLRDAKIDGAIAAVGKTLLFQLPDGMCHLRDVVGGSDADLGLFHTQHAAVFQKRINILLSIITQRHSRSRGIPDGLVVHIGQIHDFSQLVAALADVPPQDVAEDKCPVVANVGVVVDRGTADVHANLAVFERQEFLLPPGQGIV